MSLDPKAQAALALHRFGLGPRAGSIAAIASDPRGALVAELDRPGAGRIAGAPNARRGRRSAPRNRLRSKTHPPSRHRSRRRRI